jgi:hypothetical protein
MGNKWALSVQPGWSCVSLKLFMNRLNSKWKSLVYDFWFIENHPDFREWSAIHFHAILAFHFSVTENYFVLLVFIAQWIVFQKWRFITNSTTALMWLISERANIILETSCQRKNGAYPKSQMSREIKNIPLWN